MIFGGFDQGAFRQILRSVDICGGYHRIFLIMTTCIDPSESLEKQFIERIIITIIYFMYIKLTVFMPTTAHNAHFKLRQAEIQARSQNVLNLFLTAPLFK